MSLSKHIQTWVNFIGKQKMLNMLQYLLGSRLIIKCRHCREHYILRFLKALVLYIGATGRGKSKALGRPLTRDGPKQALQERHACPWQLDKQQAKMGCCMLYKDSVRSNSSTTWSTPLNETRKRQKKKCTAFLQKISSKAVFQTCQWSHVKEKTCPFSHHSARFSESR